MTASASPSWADELVHVVGALAELLTVHQTRPLGGADLDRAVTARAAVLDLAASVAADLAPRDRGAAKPPTLAEVDRDPVTSLTRLLASRTRPGLDEWSPSELLDASEVSTPAGRSWADAGRHAISAQHAWSAAAPDLNTPHAWRALGAAAALTEAIGVLDTDLAGAATTAGRGEITTALASAAGLRIAGHETRLLAAAQPDPPDATTPPPVPHPGPSVPPPGAVPVNTPRALPDAAVRLAALLTHTEVLTPRQISAAAQAGRDLSVLAAQALPEHREQLAALAQGLHAATGEHRALAALVPATRGAAAVEVQAGELHRFTLGWLAAQRAGGAASHALDADIARQLAHHLSNLTAAITDAATRQVADRRWAIRDRSVHSEATDLQYAIARLDAHPHHQPRMLADLREARVGAARLSTATAPTAAELAAAAQPPPHRTLGAAIDQHRAQQPPRAHPAQRPRGPAR